jgi:hypothetical protein
MHKLKGEDISMTRHDESGPIECHHKAVSFIPGEGCDTKKGKTSIAIGPGIHTFRFLDAEGIEREETATDLGMLILLSRAGYNVELKKLPALP